MKLIIVVTSIFIDDRIGWSVISQYQHLSDDIIREFADRIDWSELLKRLEVSSELIRECEGYIDWKVVARECWYAERNLDGVQYPEKFIAEFGDKFVGYYDEIKQENGRMYDAYEYDDYDDYEH